MVFVVATRSSVDNTDAQDDNNDEDDDVDNDVIDGIIEYFTYLGHDFLNLYCAFFC